jgi:hypothetical protein
MFEWLSDKIDAILKWFTDFIFAVLQWLKDIPLDLFDKILEAIRYVLSSIPVPEFAQHGLQALADGMSPLTGYLLAQSGVAAGFALVASAYVFRMIRKVCTLFQW